MKTKMPYRLDLAGGWLDQPHVSKLCPGPVITLCIEPTHEFMVRGGIATSTRNHAIRMWKDRVPKGDKEVLAKSLFGYENLPGNPYFTGSQDAIGMVYPGLNCLSYAGHFWPHTIQHDNSPKVFQFLEEHIRLVPVGPRADGFDVTNGQNITHEGVCELAGAAQVFWVSLGGTPRAQLVGRYLTNSFKAQIKMFPAMLTAAVQETIDRNRFNSFGWKVTGAGGGGYVLFIAKREIEGSIKIKIKRSR